MSSPPAIRPATCDHRVNRGDAVEGLLSRRYDVDTGQELQREGSTQIRARLKRPGPARLGPSPQGESGRPSVRTMENPLPDPVGPAAQLASGSRQRRSRLHESSDGRSGGCRLLTGMGQCSCVLLSRIGVDPGVSAAWWHRDAAVHCVRPTDQESRPRRLLFAVQWSEQRAVVTTTRALMVTFGHR